MCVLESNAVCNVSSLHTPVNDFFPHCLCPLRNTVALDSAAVASFVHEAPFALCEAFACPKVDFPLCLLLFGHLYTSCMGRCVQECVC